MDLKRYAADLAMELAEQQDPRAHDAGARRTPWCAASCAIWTPVLGPQTK